MAFHAKDGWYFERQPDGSVQIWQTDGDGRDHEVIVTAETWASIVASVSLGGEENGRFYEALAFHNNSRRKP